MTESTCKIHFEVPIFLEIQTYLPIKAKNDDLSRLRQKLVPFDLLEVL